MRTDRDDIDEERNEYPDQGVEHAVQGKTGNTGVGSVCDGHTQKSDAGNVRQCVLAHEIDEIFEGRKCKRVFFFLFGAGDFEMGRFFDDLGKKHEWNDAKRDQQIGKDGMRLEFNAPDQEKHEHAGETADKGADCPVQPDTERTLDFRLQANHRRDGRIKRRTGSDIKKKIDQTADKDRYRCLDDDDSHIKLIIKTVFIS